MGIKTLPVNSDLAAVCDILSRRKGPVKDLEIERRVRERGDLIREQIRTLHGVQEDSVQVIREIRNGE